MSAATVCHTLMANKLTLSAVGFLALLAAGTFAQTATTDPVGFVTVNLHQGQQDFGLPMLNDPLFTARVSSVSGTVVTLDAAGTNVGTLLTSGKPYYVEVIRDPAASSPMLGDRFDVDTAATITSANASVTIKTATPNFNTVAGVPAGINGCSVVLRKHVTLGQLTQNWGTALRSGTTTANSDGILLLLNGSVKQYSLINNVWKRGPVPADDDVIPPGAGVSLRRVSADSTAAICVGQVRANDFVQPVVAGQQFFSQPFPIKASIRARGFVHDLMNLTNGDKLMVLTGGKLVQYVYSYDGTQADPLKRDAWKSGPTNKIDDVEAIQPESGFYLQVAAADANYIYTKPTTY